MNITKSQQARLDHAQKMGTVLFSEINESGYLNFTVLTRSKIAPVKEMCIGRQGGIHVENWYKGVDENNTPINCIWEWSLLNGCTKNLV